MTRSWLTTLIVKCKGKPDARLVAEAIEKNKLSALKKLLFLGADLDLPCTVSEDLPLNVAIRKKNLPALEWLIQKGADLEKRHPKTGETVLHMAAKQGHSALTRTLLGAGANVLARDPKGYLAIHHAAQSGSTDSVLLLLENRSPIQDQDNENRDSLLHLAVKKSDLSMIDLILEKGGDLNASNLEGTVFLWAACFGDMDIAKHLLQKGADINIAGKGGSPLYLVACFGREALLEQILNSSEGVKHLESPDPVTFETPLHGAAKNGSLSIVTLLLRKGANLQAVTPAGDTALHLAASNGHSKLLELILSKGTRVNPKNHAGETPLLQAVKRDFKECVEILLAHGADTSIADSEGRNPLYFSKTNRHSKISELLGKGVHQNV